MDIHSLNSCRNCSSFGKIFSSSYELTPPSDGGNTRLRLYTGRSRFRSSNDGSGSTKDKVTFSFWKIRIDIVFVSVRSVLSARPDGRERARCDCLPPF